MVELWGAGEKRYQLPHTGVQAAVTEHCVSVLVTKVSSDILEAPVTGDFVAQTFFSGLLLLKPRITRKSNHMRSREHQGEISGFASGVHFPFSIPDWKFKCCQHDCLPRWTYGRQQAKQL